MRIVVRWWRRRRWFECVLTPRIGRRVVALTWLVCNVPSSALIAEENRLDRRMVYCSSERWDIQNTHGGQTRVPGLE